MELITSNTQTMSSREIADITAKNHSDVMRDIRNMYDQLGQSISASAYTDSQNKERRHYELDQEMTLLLVSGYNVKLRHKIIKRWQELEEQQPVLPSNYIQALESLIVSEKEKAIALEQLQIAAPKIEVYERLADRKGDVSTTVLAKQIGTTAFKLNKFLREVGAKWLQADLPKAGFQDWFNVVADVKNGHEFTQCLITPKGQIEIARKWEAK